MQYKTIILVDGENLVFRYQKMLEDQKPLDEVVHIRDCFVWHPDIMAAFYTNDIVRVGYYTTVAGDDLKVDEAKKTISDTLFRYKSLNGSNMQGTLVPYVFKKNRQGSKTKSVDINITIDALRYAYGGAIDKIIFITGDGDYTPVLREVMARGKMVQAGALSSDLNNEIKNNVDDFIDLDSFLFESEQSESPAT